MLTCLSEKDFEIITRNKSSVGKSIPICTKLLTRDLRSFKFNLSLLIDETELINI